MSFLSFDVVPSRILDSLVISLESYYHARDYVIPKTFGLAYF